MFRLTWDPWECARNRNVKESLQMEREKELSDPNGACGHDNHGGGAVLITLKQEFDVSPEGPEPRDKRPASKAWCRPTGKLAASLSETITYVM